MNGKSRLFLLIFTGTLFIGCKSTPMQKTTGEIETKRSQNEVKKINELHIDVSLIVPKERVGLLHLNDTPERAFDFFGKSTED